MTTQPARTSSMPAPPVTAPPVTAPPVTAPPVTALPITALRGMFAFFAVIASLASLGAVLDWGAWYWQATGLSAAMFLILIFGKWVLRDTRFSFIAPLASLYFALVFILWHAAPSKIIAGFIPTPSAFSDLIDHLQSAANTIAYEPPPVHADARLVLVVLCVTAIVTVLVDLLALQSRTAGFAVLPLLGLWTPAIALTRVVPLWVTLAAFLSWLALLASDTPRTTSARRALRMGGGLLTAAIVLLLTGSGVAPSAATLASWGSIEITKNQRPTSMVHRVAPITIADGLELSHILSESSDQSAIRYRTEDKNPDVLRLKIMSEYQDGNWLPATQTHQVPHLPLAPRSAPSLTEGAVLEVEHTALRDHFGISGGKPLAITDGVSPWYINEETDEIVFPRHVPGPYQVAWDDAAPAAHQLRESATVSPSSAWLQLPSDLPKSFHSELASAKNGAENAYDIALNIQQWFRADGGYKYEVTNDAVTGEALRDFFATKTGFCVHYATAMTLMLRAEGIPARVAVGFLAPGGSTQSGWVEVGANRAHAWPEVYFGDQHGWIRFEPTPAAHTGAAPTWAQPTDTPPPTAQDDPQSAPQEEPNPTTPTQNPGNSDASPDTIETGRPMLIALRITLILVSVAIVSSVVIAARRQSLRKKRARASAAGLWEEARGLVCPHAPDVVDRHWIPARAPSEIAQRISDALPQDLAEAVTEMARSIETSAFGPTLNVANFSSAEHKERAHDEKRGRDTTPPSQALSAHAEHLVMVKKLSRSRRRS